VPEAAEYSQVRFTIVEPDNLPPAMRTERSGNMALSTLPCAAGVDAAALHVADETEYISDVEEPPRATRTDVSLTGNCACVDRATLREAVGVHASVTGEYSSHVASAIPNGWTV
jgi:hypothetical protein